MRIEMKLYLFLKSALAISLVIVLLFLSCARDKTAPGGPEAQPVEIVLKYQLEADISPDLYYFFVFNFSNSPRTDEDSRPRPFVSGPDRGANWERYVVFHGSAPTTSPANLSTLERKDLPKLTPVGKAPKDVAYADFNGDTYLDLAVADSADDTVSILINNKNGTFTRQKVDVGDEPTRVLPFNLDGDNDTDLLVSNFGDSENGKSVSLLVNDGTGKLTQESNLSLPAQPLALASQDLNADGKQDLVVTLFTDSPEGNKVAVFLAGETGFNDPVFYDVGKNPVDVAIAMLDSDNNFDLLVVNGFDGEGGNSVSLLKGDGAGGFELVASYPTGRSPQSVAVAPLNGDSFMDFVVANSFDNDEEGNSVSVFLSQGEMNYVESEKVPVGRAPSHVLLFDVNRDMKPDLIVSESYNGPGGNQIRRLLGTEDGSFGTPLTAPTGRAPLRLVLADMNQDGYLDAVVVNSFDGSLGNSITVLEGTSEGAFRGAVLYWTDEVPKNVANEPWFRGFRAGNNYLELRIDPLQFTDLLGNQPDDFLVDFLVATTGIDKLTNPQDLGNELDWLLRPIVVEVRLGFNTDEERSNLEDPATENTPIPPPPEGNIVDWSVEVK